jgi:hypothetical protein
LNGSSGTGGDTDAAPQRIPPTPAEISPSGAVVNSTVQVPVLPEGSDAVTVTRFVPGKTGTVALHVLESIQLPKSGTDLTIALVVASPDSPFVSFNQVTVTPAVELPPPMAHHVGETKDDPDIATAGFPGAET